MKKLLSLLLMLTIFFSCFVASANAESPINVSLCIAETLGDQGFYDGIASGVDRLTADFNVHSNIVECKSDASMFQMALIEAAETSDIVIAAGWQFWDGLTVVVPEFTDTKFIFIDNGLDGLGDNLLSITYSENQGSFLVGYAAMKMSKTGIVGVVGGENSDIINNFIVGYTQGALYANPEGTVLEPVYTDNYEAPDKGKEAALSIYGKGGDVVFAVAGKTGLGVFEAAKESGKFAIGVDSDQKFLSPDAIICSMIKDGGESVYHTISKFITDGEFAGGTIWEADMATGFVNIGYGDDTMPQQIDDALKAEIEQLKQSIIDGTIVVDSTR